MWIDLKGTTHIHESYIASVGRALALSQHVERMSRFILKCFEIVQAHESGQSFDSLEELSDQIERLLLGRIVKRFEVFGEFTQHELTVLDGARKARNFIAHEAATIVSEFPAKQDDLAKNRTALESSVRQLAAADNLLSGWSYSIQEKQPPPKRFSHEYEPLILDWVMQPILDVEES